MRIIDGHESVKENKGFIDQFEKLYNENFPIEEEREPFKNIINRIERHLLPKTIMAIETKEEKLLGACVTDYYEDGRFVMPIYMVVDPEYRKRGIGKLLFESSVSYFPHEHVFIEIDNPDQVKDSVINPNIRLSMYQGMGFEKIPIKYLQPPLKKDRMWCDSLILMHRGPKLTKNILCCFLESFYRGLGVGDSDEFRKITEEIKKSAVPE